MKHYVTAVCLALLLSAPAFGQMLRPVQDEKGRYGFENEYGTTAIKPKYDSIQFNFYQGTACVVKSGKFLLINSSGKEISKSYTWIDTFDSHDLCLFNNGGKIDENGYPRGGQFGYLDLSGKEIIPAKYDFIGEFNNYDIAMVRAGSKTDKNGNLSGGKFGFININGKIVTKPKYAFIGQPDPNGLSLVNVGGKIGDDGNITVGKFGYVNERGEEIVPPIYDNIGIFDKDGICWTNKGGHPYKSNNSTENHIDKLVERTVGDNADDEVVFKKRIEMENIVLGGKWDVFGNRIRGGKFGFVNSTGKVIVPAKYNSISDHFCEGRAVLMDVKKLLYIDMNGHALTEYKRPYNQAELYSFDYNYNNPHFNPDFHNGVACVQTLNSSTPYYGMIDLSGNEIASPQYAGIEPMDSSGFTVAKIYDTSNGFNERNVYIYTSRRLEPNKYAWAAAVNVALATDTNTEIPYKYGLVSNKGQRLTQMKYDAISISNGVARCRIGSFVGFVDSLGREITPVSLLKASDFSHNVAIVMISAQDVSLNNKGGRISSRGAYSTDATGAKYGLINREGVALTDFVFDHMYNMNEGLIPVEITGQGCGWINSDGEYAIPLEYEMAGGFNGGYALARRDGKFGIIDKENNVIVDFAFDGVSNDFAAHSVFSLRLPETGKWGGFDNERNVVIPFEFDSSDDVAKAADEVYVPKGCVALTDREVQKFKIRLLNLGNHFKVNETIPDGYWDY